MDHLSILFPEGGFDVAASTYRDNLASKTLNSTLVSMVSEFARIKGGLRVLEVGAGTGGSSDSLIDALEGTGSTYLLLTSLNSSSLKPEIATKVKTGLATPSTMSIRMPELRDLQTTHLISS